MVRRMTNTPPTKSPTYKLVSEKVGTETIDYLRKLRTDGLSWRSISLRLYREHELDVTEVTLRKWWDDAHAEPEPEPAAT